MSVGKSRWDDVGYIISSRYRVLVLKRLMEGPATPSLIAADSESSITHVSRALQQLREQSHVTLLVSEDRKKGRVYGITDEGRSVWETLASKDLV